MHDIIPQPPERTATPAELADHDARIERARTGQQLPRTLHALAEQGARLVHCGQCWQRPGRPCTVSGPAGDHLARYMRAERKGLITRAELAAVVRQLGAIAPHVIVLDPGEVTPEPMRQCSTPALHQSGRCACIYMPRLDGCICQAIAGSHAHGCQWSAR